MRPAGGPDRGDADRLQRRLDRERGARTAAEAIAERTLRNLYEHQQTLERHVSFVQLLQAIAVASNESSTADEALQFALDRVCEYTRWPIGHVYLATADTLGGLVPSTIWHADDTARFEAFRRDTQATRLPLGVGLPGRVLATGKPAWIPDIATDANFPRVRAGMAVGIRAAFAFPVQVGAEVAAVLEFFSLEALEPDEELLEALGHIGTQLGRVIERARAESELREANQRLTREIAERQRAEAELAHLAFYDALTGLPNRRLLEDRLRQALLTNQRDRAPLALVLLDLDRFKEVNDALGHPAGDALLQQVGQRLRSLLRASDTVSRLGGDEFAVLLPRADAATAALTAEKLLLDLKRPFLIRDQLLNIEASMGIADYPKHGQTAEELLRQADVAMYAAKRSGSGFMVYTGRHDQHSLLRLVLLGELRTAIEQGALVLHYQPKVRLDNGALAGVEALVRWSHPTRGMIPPDQFIPAAEETGLIKPLDRWVIEAALRQCRAWSAAGRAIPVAVNLSPRSLHDADLPDDIAGLLAAQGVPAALLRVEVTEGAVMADPAQAERILGRLRALGIGVALDDFGTGYSSLGRLKELPVDELKIDRSFVSSLVSSQDDATIVRAAIELGHGLGLTVVAEGIEDQATYDLLAALGCDVGQGYHLSRPLPSVELEQWLTQLPAG